MDVKRGFKRTEVGVIPEDWDITTVGAEFSIQLGKMLDAERNVGELKPYLSNRSVQWGRIDTDDLPLVRMSRADMQKYRLECGDLLVCEGGEVGRAAIWDRPMVECYYQKALHRLRPLKDYRARLLLEVLHQHSLNGILTNFVTQTSIAHLPRDKFLLVPIPMPPEPEQDALIEVVHDVDKLLEELAHLIAKKRDLKQAAMQQLLTGQTRLPGFHGEWEVKRLGDVLAVRHGRSQKGVESDIGTIPILATGGQIGWSCKPLYDKPSVLIGRKGTIDRPQYMDGPFWTVDTLFYSEMIGSNCAKFLFYLFCIIDWMGLNEASGVPSLNSRTIEAVEHTIPEPPEQKAIAEVLSDMDAELSALEARRDKTLALKQAMMQELLTGRTRLV